MTTDDSATSAFAEETRTVLDGLVTAGAAVVDALDEVVTTATAPAEGDDAAARLDALTRAGARLWFANLRAGAAWAMAPSQLLMAASRLGEDDSGDAPAEGGA